jgi:alkylhydroperoxidase/carboxymuconolactone decarboxylase family protein YurZ
MLASLVASRVAQPTKKEARMTTETTDTPVLDLIKKMTADSLEATTLDEKQLMLVRIAALVAIDAPPASYLVNLGAASELGIDVEEVRGVFAGIAPIVGTPRIVAATGNIMRAVGLAVESDELEKEFDVK